MDISEEARRYFTKHYPRASKPEIAKQVKDWEMKMETGEALVSFFVERVGPVKGRRMLDVGFGNGGIAIAFSKAGAEAYGVDVDPELKEIADRNASSQGASVDLRVYGGDTIPFEDGYFDYATSFSVLEHVTHPERVLDEVLRVLRPGGRFLLTLPNRIYPKETHTLAYFVSYLPRSIARVYLRILKRSALEDDNLHFYSYFAVMKMLKKSRFRHELVHKDMSGAGKLKRFIAKILKAMGVHYTAFLPQLIFVIEKK